MTDLLGLSDALAVVLGSAAVNSLILGSGLTEAVWGLLKLLPGWSAATRYVVWWATLGAALLLGLTGVPAAPDGVPVTSIVAAARPGTPWMDAGTAAVPEAAIESVDRPNSLRPEVLIT